MKNDLNRAAWANYRLNRAHSWTKKSLGSFDWVTLKSLRIKQYLAKLVQMNAEFIRTKSAQEYASSLFGLKPKLLATRYQATRQQQKLTTQNLVLLQLSDENNTLNHVLIFLTKGSFSCSLIRASLSAQSWAGDYLVFVEAPSLRRFKQRRKKHELFNHLIKGHSLERSQRRQLLRFLRLCGCCLSL